MRELNFTEKYVLYLILQEAKDRWSKNTVYQGLEEILNEELDKFIKRQPKTEFAKEYTCKWEKISE